MPRVISAILWLASRPGRAGGPILHKELRVASRRRRCYVLRFTYVALLATFAAMAWADAFGGWDPVWSARDVTVMAEVGKSVVTKIVWFQFCTAPLIVMVMLSRAVSDEVYHGTLGVLMTTPLSGWQIVLGKLLSGLWQMLVLLGASVPLLALLGVQLVMFLSGVGLYFGSVLKRTGTAVPLTVAVAAALWLLPGVAGEMALNLDRQNSTAGTLLMLSPAAQSLNFVEGAANLGASESPAYESPVSLAYGRVEVSAYCGPARFTLLMAITTGFYAALGALFVRLTVRRLRRKIFG